MPPRERRPGALIARGNTSDIWSWTPTTVVKVLHVQTPRHWATIEADITQRVHAAGIAVPEVEGVVEVDGRPGIVFERIEGETMWQRMRSRPNSMPDLIERLIDIQVELHAASPVEGLPDLAMRTERKVDEARLLPAEERAAARALLRSLPTGSALCHGDMHPANIVMADRGPVIVDWFDAATGRATADIARSSLLMRPPHEGTVEEQHLEEQHLEGADAAFLDRLHCAYVAAAARRGLIDLEPFAAWEAVVAVARMSEPVPTDDLVRLWRVWRSDGSGPSKRMLDRCMARAGSANQLDDSTRRYATS